MSNFKMNRVFTLATIAFLLLTNWSFGQSLSCSIKSDKLIYKARKIKKGKVPIITVEIKNNTDSIVNLVKTLDGSNRRIRFPYAYFKIEIINDTAYRTQDYSYCGNYDGIDTNDFVKVLPGKTFSSYDNQTPVYADYTIYDRKNYVKKGKYKITFYYSTNEPDFKKWMGDPYAGQRKGWFDRKTGKVLPEYKDKYSDLILLFNKVPKMELISNELIIEVK